jgi:16S rRNA (adenine1518-N6/adenine1519-N6)-dimethyltransferase
LGQHFLVEPIALRKITALLDLKPDESLVEIGPGLGFLTRFLSTSGADITAVELDREAIADLEVLKMPGVNLVHEDFLQFDLSTIKAPFKVAGNVPYQITTPIIARLFGEIGEPQPWFSNIEKVVLTVQLEVAQRFVAQPNSREYSQITLLTNYFSEAKILFELSATEFYPPPKVQSAVVEFIPLAKPPIDCTNTKLLRKLIKAGFSQRRKMLRNNLGFLHLSDDAIGQVFKELSLDPQIRAERLTLQTYAALTNSFDALQKSASTT